MPAKTLPVAFNATSALLHAYSTNDRINHYLIRGLPAEVWRAIPPFGKGRTVAAMCAHIHNVRLMWLRSAAPEKAMPAKVEGDDFSAEDVIDALIQSCAALHAVLEQALKGDGRIRGFKPDVGSFAAYLFAHDAHHRGQITMLARQLGHPVSQSVMYGIWEWGAR